MMKELIVLVIVLMTSNLGTSQSNNNNTDTNPTLRLYCGTNPTMTPSSSLFSSLNSTISDLRSQLWNKDVYFARAQDLSGMDFVYGLAQCRDYLLAAECVACFDAAVSSIKTCPFVTGANVFLDNCFLRFENSPDFYENAQGRLDVELDPTLVCGNESTSETTIFNQTVGKLLSDIRIVTPKTSNFYVASTKRLPSDNTTIYAIAQCVSSISRPSCEQCLGRSYNNLYSCLPSTEGRTIDLGCFLRYSRTPFFQDNQTTNIIPFLSEGSSRKLGMIVGASVGLGILLLILASFLWYKVWKKPKTDEDTLDKQLIQGVNTYKYKDLQSATRNFSEEYNIGKGGYGEVFKAILENENVVAVKKLHDVYDKAKLEFINEVKLISNIRHRNLMQLLGWSSDGPQLLLVLEYMPQGSLTKFLWGEKRGTLNWRQRLDIMLGIARGLVHLHEELHVKIIHRDIKSDNILLDDDFQPKIADFGLARFQPEDKTHVSTRFAGTLGYTAPEYARHGRLSEKVDTYSFGIVALEIISGQKGTTVDSNSQASNVYLLQHAWELYESGIHIELVDTTLDPNQYEEENVKKMIELALMCTQSPATLRPNMSEVVLMLSSERSLGERQMSRPTFLDPQRRISALAVNR
ncbi:hypothetical protein LXL04_014657 [Taraxacum kok-saghyz]